MGQQDVLDVLKRVRKPMTEKEIAQKMGRKSVNDLLRKLRRDNDVLYWRDNMTFGYPMVYLSKDVDPLEVKKRKENKKFIKKNGRFYLQK